MNEPASKGPTLLGYEQKPEPPCVVRTPGRVAVLFPPVPAWIVAGSVLVLGAVWAASVFMAGWAALANARRPWAWREVLPGGAFLGAAPLVITFVFAGLISWWVRSSGRGGALEVTGDEVVYSTPGLWTMRVSRWPVARVREIAVGEDSVLGRGAWVRVEVRVKLVGWRIGPWRQFYTTDRTIAGEIRRAFDEALGRSR